MVFHYCPFKYFHFPASFCYFWGVLFTSLFLQVFLFHHRFYYCFPVFFHFTKFLYRDCFLSCTSIFVLCATDFFIHFLPTFGKICFYQGFLGVVSSVLKAAGSPNCVENIDMVHLSVWITHCSGKGISQYVLFMY